MLIFIDKENKIFYIMSPKCGTTTIANMLSVDINYKYPKEELDNLNNPEYKKIIIVRKSIIDRFLSGFYEDLFNNITFKELLLVVLTIIETKPNKNAKLSISDEYFQYLDKYQAKYGKKTVLLMQVGSFHEAYCTNDKGLNLIELAQKLDVVCTKKNGGKELTDSNPRMMGFPTHVTQTFIEKLINMNYTVVLIDQTTEPPNPKREITGIYSPGIYINDS